MKVDVSVHKFPINVEGAEGTIKEIFTGLEMPVTPPVNPI
jgi:hypothetical protein